MNNKYKRFIDFLVIIINFSYGLSIVGGLVDLIPIRFTNIRLFVPLAFVYLLRFGPNFELLKRIGSYPILFLWLSFLLFEAFQGIVLSKLAGVDMLINISYYLLFACYIYNIYKEDKEQSFMRITQPYRWYALYNMVVILLAAILIFLGILSPATNEVSNKFNLFATNVSEMGATYYFPGYLTTCDPNEFRILALLNIPDLNGLSHETQALCYSILPAFFLMLGGVKKSTHILLMYLLLIATLIIAPSATAMLCIMAVIGVEVLWKCVVKKQSRFLLLVVILIVVSLATLGPILYEYSTFLDSKIAGDASSDYSKTTLMYVVNPKSILGDGILLSGHGDEMLGNENVGFLSCCFLVAFYIVIMVKTTSCVFSHNTIKHYIGMASLYFWLHSLKLSVQTFTYPYCVFVIFLLAFADRFEKIKTVENNSKNHCN